MSTFTGITDEMHRNRPAYIELKRLCSKKLQAYHKTCNTCEDKFNRIVDFYVSISGGKTAMFNKGEEPAMDKLLNNINIINNPTTTSEVRDIVGVARQTEPQFALDGNEDGINVPGPSDNPVSNLGAKCNKRPRVQLGQGLPLDEGRQAVKDKRLRCGRRKCINNGHNQDNNCLFYEVPLKKMLLEEKLMADDPQDGEYDTFLDVDWDIEKQESDTSLESLTIHDCNLETEPQKRAYEESMNTIDELEFLMETSALKDQKERILAKLNRMREFYKDLACQPKKTRSGQNYDNRNNNDNDPIPGTSSQS